MNLRLPNRLSNATSGFSLIEVVLAVAVIAIGLLVIIGLLPQGIQSSRDVVDSTLSANVAQDVLSTIRNQPFTNVNLTGTFRNLRTFVGSETPLYFNDSGSNVATAAQGYFRVTVQYQPVPAPGPSPMSLVQAIVVWPAQSATPLNTSIFVTQVAWYY